MWQHLENVKNRLLELSDVDDLNFDGYLFESRHYVMLTLEQNPTAISNGFISKILDKWAYGHLLVPVTGRCSGALLNKSDFG
ncbi:DNA-binding transcriptional repressor UxuR [Citrobacter werkmanii]|nr:DNA-binding transcriptional repressor UxuR [Citrobacter werkmanii]